MWDVRGGHQATLDTRQNAYDDDPRNEPAELLHGSSVTRCQSCRQLRFGANYDWDFSWVLEGKTRRARRSWMRRGAWRSTPPGRRATRGWERRCSGSGGTTRLLPRTPKVSLVSFGYTAVFHWPSTDVAHFVPNSTAAAHFKGELVWPSV